MSFCFSNLRRDRGGRACFPPRTPPPLAPLPKIPERSGRATRRRCAAARSGTLAAARHRPRRRTWWPPPWRRSQGSGDEVVMGRYQVAVERMNPLWKERTAKRLGGMEELERQLAGVAKQMVQQGISMISFKPQGQPRSYEVGPGKKVDKVAGEEVESLIFTKWMVLIPDGDDLPRDPPGRGEAAVDREHRLPGGRLGKGQERLDFHRRLRPDGERSAGAFRHAAAGSATSSFGKARNPLDPGHGNEEEPRGGRQGAAPQADRTCGNAGRASSARCGGPRSTGAAFTRPPSSPRRRRSSSMSASSSTRTRASAAGFPSTPSP